MKIDNVLSIFDGMSCGNIALKELGIIPETYYASEIDKHAIGQTQLNFPNTIQLGSVVLINAKTLYLSEVYSYICKKYFNYELQNLQGIIPEWEMLHRINEKQSFAAYFGTQKQNEKPEVSKNTDLSINDRIWFFRNEMGSSIGVYDIVRGGERRAQTNKIDVGDLCKHSFWWNGNGQHEPRIDKETVIRTKRKSRIGGNKKEIEQNNEISILNTGSQGSSKENGHSTISESGNDKKLSECYEVIGSSRNGEEKTDNRREEKTEEVCYNEKYLLSNHDTDGTFKENGVLLPIYKETQVTIIECEWGVIIQKGVIEATFGGSPCQSFSFAGKRNGMSTTDKVEIYTLEKYLTLKEQGFEFEGQSYLFWEYMRILTDIRKYNPNVLFLLENVEMGAKWERILSEAIGVYGVHINSALVSAQNRKRIYWSNIRTRQEGFFGELHSDIPQPADRGILLKDILETEVPEKYYLSDKMLNYFDKRAANFNNGKVNIRDENDKATTITASCKSVDISDNFVIDTNGRIDDKKTGKGGTCRVTRGFDKTGVCIEQKERGFNKGASFYEKSPTLSANSWEHNNTLNQNMFLRRLTPTECSRLQTIPDWYKWGVSDTQQYKLLGNGWSVEVIKHIFKYINNEKIKL